MNSPARELAERIRTLAVEYMEGLLFVEDGDSIVPTLNQALTNAISELQLPDDPDAQGTRGFLVPLAALIDSALPKWVAELGTLLQAQDNRATAHPLYVVFEKKRIVGIDPSYADDAHTVWFNAENDFHEADAEEAAELEAEYEKTGDEREGWTRSAYVDRDEFVTACFSEKAAKDYIAANAHNLRKPHIYAETLYRNREMIAIREWILKAAPPAAPREEK